jgi:5'-methylthioadenosine phosphorylase
MMDTRPVLGVIGGSGLYAIEGLQDVEEHSVTTPFGAPSSPVVVGSLGGRRVAFLARHGLGHRLTPTEVNYRANIYALKSLGVGRVISVSACGSLREDYVPGHIVVPDQILDHTHLRARSFFGQGLVGHVSVAEPFCPDLSSRLATSVEAAGGRVHRGGASITIEGPRFSTRAESHTYRAWGMAIIGMTTSPEAFLAREAEMCYAVMAHVTDYDVWHVSEEPVTVERVVQILQGNTSLAQKALVELVAHLPADRPCDCADALRDAILTRRDRIPAETLERLALLVGRYLS